MPANLSIMLVRWESRKSYVDAYHPLAGGAADPPAAVAFSAVISAGLALLGVAGGGGSEGSEASGSNGEDLHDDDDLKR